MKNKNSHIKCFLLLFLFTLPTFSQDSFKLTNSNKQTTSFQLLSNLIVFPIEVNGKELNFILDSGVGTTILFNIHQKDSVQLHNTEKIKLRGLGNEAAVDAILSKNNTFKINNVVGTNQNLYVIFDDNYDLSSKLGLTIHGIIGYNILKDLVITINYTSKKLTFYNPENYTPKSCKKCVEFPLEFNQLKSFINVGVTLEANPTKIIPVKLLIDSGGSDALWLFENSKKDIIAPNHYFTDFLGEGLSGAIYGKRAIIESLIIGKFKFKKPTVSFPDSLYIAFARKFEERNGSIGGTVLKRFIVTFNYPDKKLTLKKSSHFNDKFRYNMSGIDIVHNGKALIKEHDFTSFALSAKNTSSGNNNLIVDYNYKYTFKPTYKIDKITPYSPAFYAGLMVDDIIVKINGKYTYGMKLEEIVAYFYKKENTKIDLLIERDGQNYNFKFRLKNVLNTKKTE